MAIDERNFRSAYYEKVGFKNVEEKRSLEILLNEKQLDLTKLRQFCLRFGVAITRRNQVWKILLGVIPIQEKCHTYVFAQRKEEFSNLTRTLDVLDISTNLPKAEFFVALYLLQAGKLKPYSKAFHNEKPLLAIIQMMMIYFDSDLDVYWLSKMFYDNVQKFYCEIPKLKEITLTILEKEDLKLHSWLVKIDALENLPLEDWYECCYAGILHSNSLARIWDKVAAGSYKILVFITIVTLLSLKQRLIRCNKLEDVVSIIQNMSEDVSDGIVNKTIEQWQQYGSPLTIYDKPKP